MYPWQDRTACCGISARLGIAKPPRCGAGLLDGMKDQQEVVLTPNTSPLGEQKDAEALKQKYLENTYGVAELPEGETLELPESAEGQKEPVEEITTG